MGHSIGLDDHYFTPDIVENYGPYEYLKAVDNLTVNEENRLKKKVKELTEKQGEIEVMKEKHEHEMNLMHQKMNKIVSMIQKNPLLAQVKPEVLVKK